MSAAQARVRAGLALVVLALLAACPARDPAASPGTDHGPRLVLLYAPCTLNRICLSPYDEGVRYTPRLAQFATESLVFERHVTEAGQSGIAYASIFSGSQADQHGIYAHPKHIPDALYLVTEAFRDNGYETFAWNGQAIGAASLNGQGLAPANVFPGALVARHPAFEGILERLEREPDYRAFVLTNFTATHAPYRPAPLQRFCRDYPDECGDTLTELGDELDDYLRLYEEHNIGLSYDADGTARELGLSEVQQRRLTELSGLLYRANVMQLDARFGKVLDAIEEHGLSERSLVAFTADHGEVMDRENALFRWTHGHALAPEVLDVPLLVRAPGLGLEPGRYKQVTRSMDLFPTLAGLCSLELPEGFTCGGRDLSAGILGGERPDLLGYSHTSLVPYAFEPSSFGPRFEALYPRQDPELIWVRIRDGDRVYKLRNAGDGTFVHEVFDHAVDAAETSNLYDPEDATQRRLCDRLARYKATLVDDYRRRLESGEAAGDIPFDERIEMLRSLGYVK